MLRAAGVAAAATLLAGAAVAFDSLNTFGVLPGILGDRDCYRNVPVQPLLTVDQRSAVVETVSRMEQDAQESATHFNEWVRDGTFQTAEGAGHTAREVVGFVDSNVN